MANLERFVYKITKQPIEQIGTVVVVNTDPNKLIATRPFLNDHYIGKGGKRRRASPRMPEGILLDGDIYLIDGHHKAKTASHHNQTVECRIFVAENPIIRANVERRKQCLIQEIVSSKAYPN